MASWSTPTREIKRQADDSAYMAQLRREDEAHVAAERAQRNHETVFLLGVAAALAAAVTIGVRETDLSRAYAQQHAPATPQFQPAREVAATPPANVQLSP